MGKEIIEINNNLTFFTEFDLDLSYPIDTSKQGPYSGYWVGKQNYFKSPEIEITLTTIKQTKDLLNWDIIEKSIAEIAKHEDEIYSLSEKVIIEFFKTSNLLNYDFFKTSNGVFVPRFLNIDYDNQYYSEHQLIREFEFTFEPDFWDNPAQGDFDLIVRLHNYKELFVNGVRWHLRPYSYLRPKEFINKHKSKTIIDKLFRK
ncbi:MULTISPECIES: hypothetical protein [Chitinophagaceae]